MPPCTAGCRVLTRPSIISGNPVTSETFWTGRPAAASALAVPPVEISSTPLSTRPRARSTRPDLSETLIIARIFTRFLDTAQIRRVYSPRRRTWRAATRMRWADGVSVGKPRPQLAVFFYVRTIVAEGTGFRTGDMRAKYRD